MPKSQLQPYVAYEFMNAGDPCPCLGINSSTVCHAIPRRLLYMVSYEPGKDAERIILDHASATFILYGKNLKQTILENIDRIADLHVFDPNCHQPVTDPTAPVIRKWERKSARLQPVYSPTHLHLV